MKAARKIPVPRLTGVRRSVEVQHGRRGVALMLRRGLHGAKNWALEPDPDGLPRPPWGKACRALVILAPLWIVLISVTSGPGQDGQQASVPQAIFFALLVALVGLAFFSARERRLGREEPWTDLPPLVTEREKDGPAESVAPSSEKATVVMEKAQVSDLDLSRPGATEEDIPDTLGHYSQIDPYALHESLQQATSDDPPPLGALASETPTEVLREGMQQAITEGAKQHVSDRTFDPERPPESTVPAEGLHGGTPEPLFSQLKAPVAEVQDDLAEATETGQSANFLDGAESDETAIHEDVTIELRPPLQVERSEPSNTKVGAPVQPLQGELQVQYAIPGPYEPGEGPIADDWWAVKPDVADEAAVEAAEAMGLEAGSLLPEPATTEAAEEPAGAAGESHPQGVPAVVTRWIAAQFGPDVSEAEKESARVAVLRWLHEEVAKGRITQSEAARMCKVHKSTVSRWLSPDPWAD